MRLAILSVLISLVAWPAFAVENPPAYSVTVKLSPAAEKKITAMKEGITVWATYNVEAGPKVKDGFPLLLGEEKRELKGAGTVTAGKVKLDQKELRKGKKGAAPTLLVTVYSSRLTAQDNLLDCDLFDGPFADIPRDKPIEIMCKLIEE